MESIWVKMALEVLFMVAKYLPIRSIKRALSKRYVESKLIPEAAKAEFAFLANSGQIGTMNNPFNYVGIRKDFDNRSLDNLKIEYIFLRTYINGAAWGNIIWQNAEREFFAYRSKQGDIQTYPPGFIFTKNDKTLIRFGIAIPPFVSLEEPLYVSFVGYITLKSSLVSFNILITDNIQIDKKEWSK